MKPNPGPAGIRAKWRGCPLSLRIFVVHTVLSLISVLLMMSPLADKPGAMHPFLLLPFFYLLFCFIPYLVSLVFGIDEVSRKPRKAMSAVALGCSVLMLAGIAFLVAHWLSVAMSM